MDTRYKDPRQGCVLSSNVASCIISARTAISTSTHIVCDQLRQTLAQNAVRKGSPNRTYRPRVGNAQLKGSYSLPELRKYNALRRYPFQLCASKLIHLFHLDTLQLPIPHCVSLRRRSRHPGSRVLQRLPLLHRVLAAYDAPLLRAPRRSGIITVREAHVRHEQVFQRAVRVLDRRADRGACRLHTYVDIVLRISSSLMG